MCNRGGNCHVPYLTINWLELKSTPHSCTLKHRTTILISSACNIINDYSKLFIVAIPNKTIKILPYLVTRAKSPYWSISPDQSMHLQPRNNHTNRHGVYNRQKQSKSVNSLFLGRKSPGPEIWWGEISNPRILVSGWILVFPDDGMVFPRTGLLGVRCHARQKLNCICGYSLSVPIL